VWRRLREDKCRGKTVIPKVSSDEYDRKNDGQGMSNFMSIINIVITVTHPKILQQGCFEAGKYPGEGKCGFKSFETGKAYRQARAGNVGIKINEEYDDA